MVVKFAASNIINVTINLELYDLATMYFVKMRRKNILWQYLFIKGIYIYVSLLFNVYFINGDGDFIRKI